METKNVSLTLTDELKKLIKSKSLNFDQKTEVINKANEICQKYLNENKIKNFNNQFNEKFSCDFEYEDDGFDIKIEYIFSR